MHHKRPRMTENEETYLMASAKGLQPCLFLTLTGAPWAVNRYTHSRRPKIAAKCKAVLPWGSRKAKSVWFWRIKADNSLTSPRNTHSWMGNSSARKFLGTGPFSSAIFCVVLEFLKRCHHQSLKASKRLNNSVKWRSMKIWARYYGKCQRLLKIE